MKNPREIINKKLSAILSCIEDLPKRQPCDCGAGAPDISFDFDGQTWTVFCYGCNATSDKFSYPDLAIDDFNQRFSGKYLDMPDIDAMKQPELDL